MEMKDYLKLMTVLNLWHQFLQVTLLKLKVKL